MKSAEPSAEPNAPAPAQDLANDGDGKVSNDAKIASEIESAYIRTNYIGFNWCALL